MERRRDRAGKQSRRSRWPHESERVLGTSKSSREADEPASRASGVKTPAGSRLGARKWRQPSRNAPTGAGLPGDALPPEPGGGGSAWSGAGRVCRSCVKPASDQEDEAPSRGDAHLQESSRWKPKLAEAETLMARAQVPGRQPGRPLRGAHQRGEPASRVTGLGQEIRIRPLLASCMAPGGWVPSVWGGPTAGSGEAGLENAVSGARASEDVHGTAQTLRRPSHGACSWEVVQQCMEADGCIRMMRNVTPAGHGRAVHRKCSWPVPGRWHHSCEMKPQRGSHSPGVQIQRVCWLKCWCVVG